LKVKDAVEKELLKGTTSTAAAISVKSTKTKPRIVVIGAGWGGYRVAQDLDKSKFDVELISPRNYFLFTPLLPSTTVGTLEFRAIQEPVRSIPGLRYTQVSL
jgi:NADH dehydrogenase FAD-containing subunit